MKAIVEKDGVTKEIDNDGLVADYLMAGWKRKQEIKSPLDINKGK